MLVAQPFANTSLVTIRKKLQFVSAIIFCVLLGVPIKERDNAEMTRNKHIRKIAATADEMFYVLFGPA